MISQNSSFVNIVLLAGALISLPTSVADTTRLFAQNVGLLVDARLDPLVNPDSCSSHVHSIYGNAKFGAKIGPLMFEDADWRNIEGKEEQTTSEIIPNLSLYWAPSLYIVKRGVHHLVPSTARTYYRITHRPGEDKLSRVNPYPPFLQMIIGKASRKSAWEPHETGRDDIRWTLINRNRDSTNYLEHGDWSYLVDNPLVAEVPTLEMNMNFPECLRIKPDGEPRTKSPDFRSHAAYIQDWDPQRQSYCPASHPYQIPLLNLLIRYELDVMRDLLGASTVNNVSNWRLSTGDASGAGGHADFVNGWPQDMMRNMIANCTFHTSIEPGVRDCILEEYNLDGRLSKTIPYNGDIPPESIDQVKKLPTGACPAGFPSRRRRGLRGGQDEHGAVRGTNTTAAHSL